MVDEEGIGNLRRDGESFFVRRSLSRGIKRQGSLVRRERNRFADPHNPYHYSVKHAAVPATEIPAVHDPVISEPLYEAEPDESHLGIPLENLETERTWSKDDDPFLDYQQERLPRLEPEFNAVKKTSIDPWRIYCLIITFWAPSFILRLCGMDKPERQMAWREKIALLTIILYIGAIVAYLIFGFTRTVCGVQKLRLQNNQVDGGYLIINGDAYQLDSETRPNVLGIEVDSEGLYGPWNAAGKMATFLFQNVNGNCLDLIVPRDNCTIPHEENKLSWYFPCKLVNRDGSTTPNFTVDYYPGWNCHTSPEERSAFYSLDDKAEVYFTWDQLRNSSRNLVVYDGHVLDLDLLNWLERDQVEYPLIFDELKDSNLQGYDLSMILTTGHEKKIGKCLTETIKVGEIDSKTIGCIASDVVLYVSLVFILSTIVIKFLVACYFRWGIAKRQGTNVVDNKSMAQHMKNVEDWSGDVHRQGPIKKVDNHLRARYRHDKGHNRSISKLDFFKKGSDRLNMAESVIDLSLTGNATLEDFKSRGIVTMTTLEHELTDVESVSESPKFWNESTSIVGFESATKVNKLDLSIIHPDVVQQPPVDYMPYHLPLVHTICFVTCYSEDEDGLRSTLDSLATSDYPNSHKLLMVVCDGLIKGSGNEKTTPEIILGMMDDFVIPLEDVVPHSYVAVASGSKRHNMAKVYAGFYKYNNDTVSPEKQQKVPMITVVKCGTPAEQSSAKPGNRGKRDSQVILMSFLQKLTFDERMSELEYHLLRGIWQVTGLMAQVYETVIMVDADTKVFPDSLSHMNAEMVKDPTIMGLCGETKIANKMNSWVTMIQVFEYYVSHHLAKAFESTFGSVTCLPGCFSMYRIKSPRNRDGFWVPILANPDILERYSDNVTETLHKKNLLLLGEDRYLSFLMLKTFPKRKQIFVPKAACKTIVPDTFKVLLSQRRRWINSTVHNLFELVLVRDLCGIFCFSMQFIIWIELIGVLVLPMALCFTFYVVIFAIVSTPTPIMSLILLALVLGLPGILVVVTATSISYLGWLIIYILALPIWNFVLPTYAYWKFDDFSWGDTRTVAGVKGTGHDEAEGDFDHSHIKMKNWRVWERESRETEFSRTFAENNSRRFY